MILILLLCQQSLFAPAESVLFIAEAEPIKPYEALVLAILDYESNGDTLAYNAKEGAVGGLQIRQCRVDHYNALRGTHYCLDDFYNYKLSVEMFLFFAEGKSYERAARLWNGSGLMTDKYWCEIKKRLQ